MVSSLVLLLLSSAVVKWVVLILVSLGLMVGLVYCISGLLGAA